MSYDPYFEKMSDTFEDITVLPLETSIRPYGQCPPFSLQPLVD